MPQRAEFVVVGWSDPEGSRPYVGALLLGYFEPDGRLVYAGRAGTGMSQKTLATLHKRLQPLVIRKTPLAAPPPRDRRFGRPLELAKVHWIRPELVAETTYLSWPDDGLLRHTVFVGLRDDKPAREVRRRRLGPGSCRLDLPNELPRPERSRRCVWVPAIAESGLDQRGEIGRAQCLGLHGGRRVGADAVEAAVILLLGWCRLEPETGDMLGQDGDALGRTG